jgi:hypothetical protein
VISVQQGGTHLRVCQIALRGRVCPIAETRQRPATSKAVALALLVVSQSEARREPISRLDQRGGLALLGPAPAPPATLSNSFWSSLSVGRAFAALDGFTGFDFLSMYPSIKERRIVARGETVAS